MPWDFETVAASVKRTGQGHRPRRPRDAGISAPRSPRSSPASSSSGSTRRFKRIGAQDVPVGFSRILEREILPQEDDILAALFGLLRY
jgi:pyruvate/2-oxoglutarate/acetoin dehydrogenase E1 component